MCHAGFLSVARKMISPVANRLRTLLREDPSRSDCSLIFTGHSAGGAVATLLFAHMMASTIHSELTDLVSAFKRIHCLTFGTPPITLLPLTKSPGPRWSKSLFLSFINEGDPVARADKAYVRSLLDLFASPPPGESCIVTQLLPQCPRTQEVVHRGYDMVTRLKPDLTALKLRPKLLGVGGARRKSSGGEVVQAPMWRVPIAPLSNAGKVVVLRKGFSGGEEDVRAEVATDEMLRAVVFGDPVMHMMKVYVRRVEILATRAVMGKTG